MKKPYLPLFAAIIALIITITACSNHSAQEEAATPANTITYHFELSTCSIANLSPATSDLNLNAPALYAYGKQGIITGDGQMMLYTSKTAEENNSAILIEDLILPKACHNRTFYPYLLQINDQIYSAIIAINPDSEASYLFAHDCWVWDETQQNFAYYGKLDDTDFDFYNKSTSEYLKQFTS